MGSYMWKSRVKNAPRYAWAAAAVAALAIAGGYLSTADARSLAEVTRTIDGASREHEVFAYLYDNIETLLPTIGIGGAIEAVQYSVSEGKLTFAHCHAVLHIVGHIAYRLEGGDLEALRRYTNPMCQGAYDHGVEAEIAAAGEAKFPELVAWCEMRLPDGADAAGAYCYHGAGHEFMRESIGSIETALSWCDRIDPSRDPANCWAGVFSEFGALALGVDSDTGEPIPGERLVSNPFTPPLEFCENLPEKYLESCVSQLTKTVVDIHDAAQSLSACSLPSYVPKTQEVCTRFFSFFYFDQRLNVDERAEVPEVVFELPAPLRRAFIEGAMQAFTEANQSGLARDVRPFCEEFPSENDQTFCVRTGSPLPS